MPVLGPVEIAGVLRRIVESGGPTRPEARDGDAWKGYVLRAAEALELQAELVSALRPVLADLEESRVDGDPSLETVRAALKKAGAP